MKRTMSPGSALLGARLASALITLIAALTLMTATASAQVTVAGSTGANGGYTTLKAAFDAINANAVQTGNNITIDIAASTTETATAALNAGDWATITIRPTAPGVSVSGTIVGAIIKLNGADNVTIDGRIGGSGTNRDLTVRNNSTASATVAIWLASVAAGNGASNNVIRNLEIAAGATANVNTNATVGVLMGGTTISLIATDGNDNDNNQFIFNRITRARYGLATRGVTTNNNEGLVITDNVIGPASFGADAIGKAGIYLQADTGALVSRNTVQFVGGDLANTTAGADRCGICIGGENWSVTESTTITSGDYTVTKNVIHDIVEERTFSAIGIRLGTTRGGAATNNLVANNFVYNIRADATAGDQVVAIGYANGHTDRIVFNSISLTGDMDPGAAASASTYANAIRVTQANSSNNANLTLMNNSIYLDVNSNTAANFYYAITLNAAAYSFGTGGLNFNNYYINPANTQLRTGGFSTIGSGNTATTSFQTLANWQAALTTPQDANSKQVDPLYFSTTSNLHLAPLSPNIDMGTTIAGIADDIDSQVRPNGAAPDIGADEFYPSGGTVQFSSATYTVTEASGVVTISVTRTGGASGAASVDFATVAGGSATGGASCTAGVDYINTSGTFNWADNDFATKTFNVTLCSDGVVEGSETVNLALSNPTGATLGTPSSAVLTILNSVTFGSAVNVGSGETFTSLTNPGGLFEAINNGALSANLTVNITSDLTTESGAISLNEFGGGFTVTILPSGGAARLISGGSAVVLLDFSGADGVVIDGLNTGGNSLTIRNTTAGTGTAVRYINDASTNTLQNTTLEGGGTSSVLFISTGVTTGNDNIQIVGNIIRDRTDAVSVPFNVINLIGSSATVSNTNILINNNQIINFTQAGILVGMSDDVTVTNNDIFQTAARTTSLFGVAVNSAGGTNLFSENKVHDLTTTLGTSGMQFNDVRATTVSQNRIYNFPSTSGSTGTLTGIQSNGSSGNPANLSVVNNMVSIVPSFTNAQSIFGIRDFGFAGNTFSAYFNTALIGGTGSGTANSWACQRGFSAPTTYTAIDNLCFNSRTGGTGNHFAGGDQSVNTGTFVSNFNFFAGTGATAANFMDLSTSSTATPVSFATWQAGPPARDANSIANTAASFNVSDFFVNAATGDLHLKPTATPVLNAGTPAGGVTNDFDDQTRSATTPDIGADELVLLSAGNLVISEFRLRGSNGISDEFIEVYNASGAAITAQAADASSGLGVAASDGVTRCTIPNGTVIPNGGHYLCVNSGGYSLASYPAGNGTTALGDATYTTEIVDNAGIAIFNNATGGASYTLANRIDAVGSDSEANTLYKEGIGYPSLITTASTDHSLTRNLSTGTPKDTDNNLADFVIVDTQATCLFVVGCATGATADGTIGGRHLGAPGPENLLSPLQRNATIKASLVDIACANSSGAGAASNTTCARHRDTTPGTNATLGTLSIRRTFKNNTGSPVTRLRFRAVDMRSLPPAAGNADLRLFTSSSFTATCVGSGGGCAGPGSVIMIEGTTLEQPPTQTLGGGLNSSASAGTITLASPLAPGASINVQFLLGVQQGGNFRFLLNVEALPSGSQPNPVKKVIF
ncbi:MAG: beta strand repeat-containing protein [Pyrinomonadaceae bacterium]